MSDKNQFKGFKQVNGLADNFNVESLEEGFLYLVRTDEDKKDGYLFFNGKKYGQGIIPCYDEDNDNEDDNVSIKALKFSSPDECTLSFGNGTQYSFDGIDWIDGPQWDMPFGNGIDIYVRGDQFFSKEEWFVCEPFMMRGSNVSVEGNIMHLLSYEEDLVTVHNEECFAELFKNCEALVDASKLELPATTLAGNCYRGMFEECRNLVNAPSILPATTLADGCYQGMFTFCASLVNAPELPAPTLANYCYDQMFYYCSSLNNIKMLATDISADNCFYQWVVDVSSTGTFECASGMSTVIPRGESGIPNGWAVTEVA